MPCQMGDITPVTKDPCNWFLFAHPDNSHYETLVELANSSRRSFEIIELWQKQRRFVGFFAARKFGDRPSSESINSSRHPLIKEMVDKISKQGPGYYRAIQKSAETARRGCSFASDAIDFCKRLLKAEDSVETLRAGLDDIKEVAKYAHQDAQDMYQQFKDIRVELFKILKDIPSGALSSQTDKNVLAQFLQASDDLASLIRNVGSFVNWWGDMNMSLMNLEEILPQVRVDGTNPFRTDTVTARWKTVHKNYVWYQRQIGEVEDYYKNVSGDLTPRSISSKIERLFDDETVVISTGENPREVIAKQYPVGPKQRPTKRRMPTLQAQKSEDERRPLAEDIIFGDAQSFAKATHKGKHDTDPRGCPK
ncbi:hypothetical protein PILCRDRAFT_337210 [Piloderma croceum F 1598]|uniref:Uncharacterized protein n=1 Tax=Piloderma croceum (strain F 1598) TaxID=765440 RepID=A0A0C3C799_PILCF|nr:hypothetical protein PILCRDRAFT_337210 [Piloderma croceum F 1598]